MRLLVCDTSNTNCSAGVFEDGKAICYELSFEKLTHSETFMPLVHKVMTKAKMKHEDLDGYAVTAGPGSFTGIRIGISAVKGMALASGKKCIAVSSTEALARSCENATMTPKSETLIVPAIDARNNRVFAQAAEDDTLKPLLLENAYDADDLVKRIEKIPEIIYGARRQIIVVGSGATVMKKAFEKAESKLNIYYAPGAAIMPKGVALAAFANPELIDARDLKASYCAVSQAERLKKND
ncbi:MAG: tRNA (adenosine(37)-N6)-threonylcarbamoyltransferase complex dimerization subunit type 1 TsaB [Saccharofermentans sp.]|jgi:tRNA threonylcarbamoyladenosine biosynthesis protein TsaB|nr:tRNA (adenosine(37)-N6)-threonylcarbamoyltransferase complex dimerization subunit type 1 TsaB [Saccharofermentans sp.]